MTAPFSLVLRQYFWSILSKALMKIPFPGHMKIALFVLDKMESVQRDLLRLTQ